MHYYFSVVLCFTLYNLQVTFLNSDEYSVTTIGIGYYGFQALAWLFCMS